MSDKEFKHEAVNEISVIYGHLVKLHKTAQSDIKADLAIETRDLCHELIYRLEMFEKRHLNCNRLIERI